MKRQRSYYAFLKYKLTDVDGKKKSCLSDIGNLVWFCLKHDYSIDQATQYFKETVNRFRTKTLKTYGYESKFTIDAYAFKDVLNINNDIFTIKKKQTNIFLYDYNKSYQWVSWRLSHDKNAEKVEDTEYNSKQWSYGLNDLITDPTETILKLVDKDDITKVNIRLNKPCNYTDLCFNPDKCKLAENGEIISIRDKTIPYDEVEPISMTIYCRLPAFVREMNKCITLERIRYNYVCFLTTIYTLFKCLDDTDCPNSDISYEEFSKPIYE